MKAIYISARDTDGPVRLARRTVASVMNAPAVTVSEGDLLDCALLSMIRTGLRHLVVVDEAGRCTGILSDRSIASAWATDYSALTRRTVASALDKEPAVVDCRGVVVDAAAQMRHCGVDAVAVVDADGAPVGVITGSDLVALLAK